MGFIQAFKGAISQTFADQWKDYYVPRANVPDTAAVFEAVQKSTNAGVGQNTKGAENIITNGSKLVVPENYALLTFQDGQLTGCITEPGGYEFRSDDPNSKSLLSDGFGGDGILKSTLVEAWERFKFGGIPASQQLAFYVNLKAEIPGNNFGTPETIYWNDSYLDLKAGGMARGSYSIHIDNPILFVKNFVPLEYLQPGAKPFDFADMDNKATDQMFDEFVSCLSSGISRFSQAAKVENIDTMDYIQGNASKFAQTMSQEVESLYHWSSLRGLSIVNVNILINYDEKTQAVLDEIRKDDQEIRRAKRMGQAYGENMSGMMAAASGQAMQSAAANENGAMMGFMGMGFAQQQGANLMGTVANMPQQPVQQAPAAPVAPQTPVEPAPTAPVAPVEAPVEAPAVAPVETVPVESAPVAPQQPTTPEAAPATEDPYQKLAKMKELLDAGVISAEDFEAAKKNLLGI